MATEQHILDCANIAQKRALLSRIGALRGHWRIELTHYRPRRGEKANAFYWAAIVTPFADHLTAQDYDVTTPEQAHEILKQRFLSVDVVNKGTGQVVGQRVRSTTELDVGEFALYVERCQAWLSEFFGLVLV